MISFWFSSHCSDLTRANRSKYAGSGRLLGVYDYRAYQFSDWSGSPAPQLPSSFPSAHTRISNHQLYCGFPKSLRGNEWTVDSPGKAYPALTLAKQSPHAPLHSVFTYSSPQGVCLTSCVVSCSDLSAIFLLGLGRRRVVCVDPGLGPWPWDQPWV